MGLHPKLKEYKKSKHCKTFSKTLKHIEKDLAKLNSTDFDAEILPVESPKSLLRRFWDPGYGDAEEVLAISTEIDDCPVEIFVPMGKAGIAPPYIIGVTLPVPMTGRAEYRRGVLGGKWHLEPKDKARAKDLKRTLPSVKMKQHQTSRKLPVGVDYTIKVAYSLEPTEDGQTEWMTHSGYEGSALTGGSRPRVIKYLEAIPEVLALLQKWNGN